jgi:putative ABC transport system ATP-binding protein
MSLIEAKHITKIYQTEHVKVVALDDVSFTINKGEFVAIMGSSGSGKSTLMHILGALDIPSSGEYILDGEKVSKLQDDELAEIRNRKIGFVFQAFNLLPRNTALRNVVIPMMYGGVEKSKRVPRAKELLKLVGLEDRMFHTPDQLSGGQKQRVAIARALAMDPSILLADEPTGNISGKHVTELMDTLVALNKQGHTIIVITHEKAIADYARRVLRLQDGKLVQDTHRGKRK